MIAYLFYTTERKVGGGGLMHRGFEGGGGGLDPFPLENEILFNFHSKIIAYMPKTPFPLANKIIRQTPPPLRPKGKFSGSFSNLSSPESVIRLFDITSFNSAGGTMNKLNYLNIICVSSNQGNKDRCILYMY